MKDRTFTEILASLRRHGWRVDHNAVVVRSGDGTLVQVLWPNGERTEAPAPDLWKGTNHPVSG